MQNRDGLIHEQYSGQGEIVANFALGDRVRKDAGDYRFEGRVIGVLHKLDDELKRPNGMVRYAVQNRDGLIHIFDGRQLARAE